MNRLYLKISVIICFSSISYFSKIDRQREFALRFRELKQELCDNLERWDGEGDGMEGGDMGAPMDRKKRITGIPWWSSG